MMAEDCFQLAGDLGDEGETEKDPDNGEKSTGATPVIHLPEGG
jgi:hypothetical protein